MLITVCYTAKPYSHVVDLWMSCVCLGSLEPVELQVAEGGSYLGVDPQVCKTCTLGASLSGNCIFPAGRHLRYNMLDPVRTP